VRQPGRADRPRVRRPRLAFTDRWLRRGERATRGHSYPQAWYEDAVGDLLGAIGSLDDHTITEVVALYGAEAASRDELTLARIAREREEASQRLARTRDIPSWQATMGRLDAEEETARQPRPQQRLAPSDVVSYLRSLPTMWADAGPEGRRAIVMSMFARIEVEGYRRMEYELTPDAVALGLDMALPVELETGKREFGRGERI
jgi:hypothetical protein